MSFGTSILLDVGGTGQAPRAEARRKVVALPGKGHRARIDGRQVGPPTGGRVHRVDAERHPAQPAPPVSGSDPDPDPRKAATRRV